MNDNVRNELCQIIQKHGQSLIDDPRRCKGLLSDLCANDKREMNVLLDALSELIPNDLVASQVRAAPLAHIERLSKKLQQNRSLAEEPARWAVESWALALGVVSAEAVRARPANVENRQLPPAPAQTPPEIKGPTEAGKVRDAAGTGGASAGGRRADEEVPGAGVIKVLLLLAAVAIGMFVLRSIPTKSQKELIRAPGQDWKPYDMTPPREQTK